MKTSVKFQATQAVAAPIATWDIARQVYPAGFGVQHNSAGISIAGGAFIDAPANTLRTSDTGGIPAALIEGASTNLLHFSAADTAGGWTASGGSAEMLSLAALGRFDGCRISSNGATWHRLLHTNRPPVSAGQVYCLSAWLILGTSGKARCILRDNAGGTETRILIDQGIVVEAIDAGTIGEVAIVPIGGALRLTIQFTPNYTGDLNIGFGPGSAVAGEDVILLAAQFEQGAAGTSYIETSGAPVMREADTVNWAAPTGTFDIAATDAGGTEHFFSAISVDANWVPPFDISRMSFFAAGTL